MNIELRNTIHSALTGHIVNDHETKAFFGLKHDLDLLPIFEKKLKAIINTISGKLGYSAYDIQGLKDKGIDIIISDSSTPEKRIAVQIKADYEIVSGLVKTLENQWTQANNTYIIEDYYIILCCDHNGKTKKDIVRQIKNTFSTGIRYSANIKIIDPEQAYYFFEKLDDIEIMINYDIASYLAPLVRESKKLYRKQGPFITSVILTLVQKISLQGSENVNFNDLEDSVEKYTLLCFSEEDREKMTITERIADLPFIVPSIEILDYTNNYVIDSKYHDELLTLLYVLRTIKNLQGEVLIEYIMKLFFPEYDWH